MTQAGCKYLGADQPPCHAVQTEMVAPRPASGSHKNVHKNVVVRWEVELETWWRGGDCCVWPAPPPEPTVKFQPVLPLRATPGSGVCAPAAAGGQCQLTWLVLPLDCTRTSWVWAAARDQADSQGLYRVAPPLASSSARNTGLCASPGQHSGTGSAGGAWVSRLESESV